jgi:antitoxin MazE
MRATKTIRITVKTWGKSLAVRLPRAIADKVGISEDTPVDISVQDGSIVLSPVDAQKKRLAKLVSLMTTESVHAGDDFGDSVGRERL